MHYWPPCSLSNQCTHPQKYTTFIKVLVLYLLACFSSVLTCVIPNKLMTNTKLSCESSSVESHLCESSFTKRSDTILESIWGNSSEHSAGLSMAELVVWLAKHLGHLCLNLDQAVSEECLIFHIGLNPSIMIVNGMFYPSIQVSLLSMEVAGRSHIPSKTGSDVKQNTLTWLNRSKVRVSKTFTSP